MAKAGLTVQAREFGGPAPGLASPAVMIVDDDPLMSKTLAMNLEDAGFSAFALSNGRAAVDHLAAGGRAAAMLLDWRMPGLDGAAVLAALHRFACPVPVIVVSGDAGVKEMALASGAVAFLEKSRGFDALLAELRATVGRRLAGAEPGRSIADREGRPKTEGLAVADDAAREIARYRREASRLVGLAASSPFTDAKAEFLRLAQHYDRLAAHAAHAATKCHSRAKPH